MARSVDRRSELLRNVAADWLRALHQEQQLKVEVTLSNVAAATRQVLPAVQHASIAFAGDNAVRTASATGPIPTLLDELQATLGEGPSITAVREQRTVRVDDAALDVRWPAYCRSAVRDTPVRSILCLPVPSETHDRAALNLYAERPNAFDAEAEEIATTYATYAAMAWSMAQRTLQFQQALASRDTIGQAKGMIMERFKIDAEQAFQLLRRPAA